MENTGVFFLGGGVQLGGVEAEPEDCEPPVGPAGSLVARGPAWTAALPINSPPWEGWPSWHIRTALFSREGLPVGAERRGHSRPKTTVPREA